MQGIGVSSVQNGWLKITRGNGRKGTSGKGKKVQREQGKNWTLYTREPDKKEVLEVLPKGETSGPEATWSVQFCGNKITKDDFMISEGTKSGISKKLTSTLTVMGFMSMRSLPKLHAYYLVGNFLHILTPKIFRSFLDFTSRPFIFDYLKSYILEGRLNHIDHVRSRVQHLFLVIFHRGRGFSNVRNLFCFDRKRGLDSSVWRRDDIMYSSQQKHKRLASKFWGCFFTMSKSKKWASSQKSSAYEKSA